VQNVLQLVAELKLAGFDQLENRKRGDRLRVPVERDHGFRWKMITQSGGT
jgi:ribosomal protein L34